MPVLCPQDLPGGGNAKTWRPLAEAGTAAAGMCVFALFVHAGRPLVLLSVSGLLAAAFAVSCSLRRESSWAATFGVFRLSRRVVTFALVGCALGLLSGILYRGSCDWSLLPGALRPFALVAALIGAAEEIVYRGYIQGRVRGLGAFPAVVLAATCHAAYKSALFALPPSGAEIDVFYLAVFTFLAGLVLGTLRALAGGAPPAITAHVCFDIVVYGDLARAPWWVWS